MESSRSLRGEVALADWQPQLTVDQQQVLEQSVATLRDAGFNSPALEILSEQLRSTTDTVQQMLDFAVDQGLLARIGPGVYLHSDTVEKAKETDFPTTWLPAKSAP